MRLRRFVAASVAAGVASLPRPCACADRAGDRPPIPEPLLTETVTDIDGAEAGEFELEANGAVMRALRGGGYAVDGSVEVEWLATRRLGLRLEPTLSRDADDMPALTAAGVSGGVSWKLLQDFERDIHVQAEAVERIPWDTSPIVQPGDSALPFAFDVRAGARRGPVTLRGSGGVGAAVVGRAEHVPLRGSVAILAPFEGTGRFGFWGIELDADGARASPVIAALDVVPNLAPAGVPLRIGLALPWVIGEQQEHVSLGLFLRIFYESEREIAFASPRPKD
jgi:hypothetical protein